MTLYEFFKEHTSAKIEVSEYGRTLAMFNNEKINEYEATIRADERARIKEMFKMYQRLELKFTLNQCKEKDGLYYLDATELFNGLIDQVIGLEEQNND